MVSMTSIDTNQTGYGASLYDAGVSGRCISVTDLRSQQWKRGFHEMEKFNARFLQATETVPMSDYWWPADPLHCWSRIWEYPYVWSALESFRHQNLGPGDVFRIADIGAAVTFFSFLLLERGY